MVRRGNYGIDDWAETVKDTLSQLGGKKPPPPPRYKPAPKSSLGQAAISRSTSRIDQANKRRNLTAAQKRRKGTVNRNVR